ncbi:MAG: metallopeptidase family protein [Acidobacteria bacterium]|nr:metallopeptidase family protein [Acidobacteriota bacterium]
MTADEFDGVVERALRAIPARYRRLMENISVVVEREPSAAQLADAGVRAGGTLLGLYQGRPRTVRSVFESFTLPDRITIFQGPHERLARDVQHLERLVQDTIWHEVAHYFGMDEPRVRAAERRRRRTGR